LQLLAEARHYPDYFQGTLITPRKKDPAQKKGCLF
jgi:hypothetical protein